MDKQIASIQKNVFTLCDYTRTVHVKEWKSLVQESKQIVEVVRNLSDQIKYLNQADLYEMPNFEDMKLFIRSTISDLIQDELLKLEELLDRFCKSNQEVKNKLSTLFKLTHDLVSNENNVLINGTARQPALSLILTQGDETTMQNFFNCYNLNDQQVLRYISLIENVDNEIPSSKFLEGYHSAPYSTQQKEKKSKRRKSSKLTVPPATPAESTVSGASPTPTD